MSFEKDCQKVIKEVSPACVKISAYDRVLKKTDNGSFSGVVVTVDGYILTAAHATIAGQGYTIQFPNGKKCIGTALGRVQFVDAALIKIDSAGSWPYCKIGRSKDLKINQPCLSISYPASLSLLSRPVVRLGYIINPTADSCKIQTTCLMEPGDSGGALFDLSGHVIALHSRIRKSLTENMENPVDNYLKYWRLLLTGQTFPKGFIPADSNSIETPFYRKQDKGFKGLDGVENSIAKALKDKKNVCVHISSSRGQFKVYALGTIVTVNAKKFIISKSSIVGNDPQINLINGVSVKAEVIGRDATNDLVLIAADDLPGGIMMRRETTNTTSVEDEGRFLVSVSDSLNTRIGVLGLNSINVPRFSAGFLDIKFIDVNGKIKVGYSDYTSSQSSALQIGDVVQSLNKQNINSLNGLHNKIDSLRPGDEVEFGVLRNGKAVIVKDVIGKRSKVFNRHIADFFQGGPSLRNDDFNDVFVHDGHILPKECGGPVFDSKGEFVGINIARLSRVNSIGIPYTAIYSFLISQLTKISSL
ncbi:trypsin-like peptidase domain-containing protein [Mucilaginibacter gracilis]|nr:trypsin-like peptidase domain-containing protein [Mucilaginibacter gracilis]